MKITEKNNRCGIFLFYDRDGIVDDYIVYMLRQLKQNISHLLVVCNGAPGDKALEILKKESDEVLVRDNSGFDVGGYREGLFHIGFDRLETFDEVALFNYTFFGGIYPFEEMFAKMDTMDLDFWGITKHHKVEYDPYGRNRYGYLPEHIQSHFLVIRRSLLKTKDYQDFMINMKNPTSYVESICDYESIFTKHFEDLGYKWDIYVNTDRYERYAYSPVMFYIKSLLQMDRCPIIKRRSFFTSYKDFLINTCGEPSVEAFEYIKEHTDYDINMIWDNILRLENMSEVAKAMHLNECIEDEVCYDGATAEDVCVAIWVKDTKDIAFYEPFLESMNGNYRVWLFGDQAQMELVKNRLAAVGNVTIFEEKIENYQQFVKAVKKQKADGIGYYVFNVIEAANQMRPYSNELSNMYKDWSCTVASTEYISNVRTIFEENPRMGLGIPPVPDFGEYYARLADGWAGHFDAVKALLDQLQIRVNINKDIAPLVPFGGNFWIKADMLHGAVLERALETAVEEEVFLFALVSLVQAQKAYTVTLYSNRYAAVEITNSDFMMRELNKAVFEKYGPNYHDVVLERVRNNTLERDLIAAVEDNWKAKTKRRIKKILPRKVFLLGKRVYCKLRGRNYTE